MRFATCLLLITLVLALAACGGGGGGSDGGGDSSGGGDTGGGGGGSPSDNAGGDPVDPPPPPEPPPANTAPEATAGCETTSQGQYSTAATSTQEGQKITTPPPTLTATLQASDADNDTLSYSLDADAPNDAGPITTDNGATVTLNTNTGEFDYTPADRAAPRGVDTFTFRVDDQDSSATATETVIVDPKIMPLGDSITDGSPSDPPPPERQIAYRLPLLEDLNAANNGNGLPFDYVGSLSEGGALLPDDQTRHNGFPGFTAADIAAGGSFDANGDGTSQPDETFPGVFQALNNNPADIVLLHIGTNPRRSEGADITTRADNVLSIVRQIASWQRTGDNSVPVTLLVARIIDQNPSESDNPPLNPPDVDAFNDMVVNRINQLPPEDRPADIIFDTDVDMFQALGGDDPDDGLYIDNLHPNNDGYGVMADVWFDALRGNNLETGNAPDILQGCPQ